MWTMDKRDRCLRTVLLVTNCIACVAVIYVYIAYVGNEKGINEFLSENIIQPEKFIDQNCTPVCHSRACVKHANIILKTIDPSFNPCENYFSFLCGGFRDKYGPDENGNVLLETDRLLLNKLNDILHNIPEKPESASSKMKTVYDSCVNYDSSELKGVQELDNLLETIGISNWPNLIEDFNFRGVSLPKVLGVFVAFSSKECFDLGTNYDNKDEEHLEMDIYWSCFLKLFDVPRELAVTMLKYFDVETKEIDTIIEDNIYVMNSFKMLFEKSKYNKTCSNSTCSVDFIHCPRDNKDDWHDFCEMVEVILNFTTINGPINTNLIHLGTDFSFFQKLFPHLQTIRKRALANFIVLNFIMDYQAELNFYFRLHKLKQNDFKYEVQKDFYELGTQEFCIRWIIDKMQVPLVNEFYRQYITNSTIEEIINNFEDSSSKIKDLVSSQKWMSEESKSSILNEINSTGLNIDIQRRIFPNDSYLDKFYEKFLPTRDSFFSNVLQLKVLSNIVKSHFIESDKSLKMTTFDVQANAEFHGPLAIQFGLLLPPFYLPDHNPLLNRILLIQLMGHELGHYVYMSMGYKDIFENKIYFEKRECIWDQFSKFKFENLNEYLNSSTYDTENVPDSISTTIIDQVIEQNNSHVLLPGLPYSAKQLLYMSSVRVWCEKTNLARDLLYRGDVHAPSNARLETIMQNSRGFPKAFQCPEGSYMNPAIKCSFLNEK